MHFKTIIFYLVLIISCANSHAVVIETSSGHSYDVDINNPKSPLIVWDARRNSINSNEKYSPKFIELSYKSKLKLSDTEALHKEIKEIFELYQKKTNRDLIQEMRDFYTAEQVSNIFFWVGSGKIKTIVKSTKKNHALEKRITSYRYFSFIDPQKGPFSPFHFKTEEYWVRSSNNSIFLPFIDDSYPKTYLNEILGIEGSNLWIAFRITEMKKEHVNIEMDIFNSQKLVKSEQIHGSIRTNLKYQDTINSYSINYLEPEATICINTTNGMFEYNLNKFTSKLLQEEEFSKTVCKKIIQ